jgi:hypothetical protein
MSASKKEAASRSGIDTQELREQEVLRANRELAAYFKGRRTEREARAALKIIKAFIRDREHMDPVKRRPLPGTAPARRQKNTAAHKTAGATKGRRRTAIPRRPRASAARDIPRSSTLQTPVGDAPAASSNQPSATGD